MRERSADVYDLLDVARGRDTEVEAADVARLVRAHLPEATSILDVACGTGIHLSHLRDQFEVAGVDLDPSMLAVAERRLPGVPLAVGDMRSFDLGRRFDAVTCLFSSIGYVHTRDDLRDAVGAMVRHLVAGGVLVVEAWFHPHQWIDGHLAAEAATGDGVAVGRVSRSRRDGDLSEIEFTFAVARPSGVETFTESHTLRLWEVDDYRRAMEAAGLVVHHDPPWLRGRSLFVGVAPQVQAG